MTDNLHPDRLDELREHCRLVDDYHAAHDAMRFDDEAAMLRWEADHHPRVKPFDSVCRLSDDARWRLKGATFAAGPRSKPVRPSPAVHALHDRALAFGRFVPDVYDRLPVRDDAIDVLRDVRNWADAVLVKMDAPTPPPAVPAKPRLSDLELADLIRRHKEPNPGLSRRDVATLVGIDPGNLSRRLNNSSLLRKTWDAFDAPRIGKAGRDRHDPASLT